MNPEDAQQKYLEYQMLGERIKQAQQQLQSSEQQIIEIMATAESLTEFSKLKEGAEILVPINNGIFAKAKLVKEDHLKVNVGAAAVVEKSIDETKELILNQKSELEKIQENITSNLKTLITRASEIENEINSKNV